jgi:hypothetical protein
MLGTLRGRLLLVFVAIAFGWVATLASVPARADQSAAADALFRQAVALAKKKQYAEAVEKFQASYALDPARGTLQGLALAEEKLGRVASASGHYRELRDLSHEAHDAQREQAAEKRIAELEPRIPHLNVSLVTAKDGAEVSLDGRALPKGALATPLPVDPGEHRVDAHAADGSTFSVEVTLVEGERRDVAVEWNEPAAKAVTPPPPVAATHQTPSPVAPGAQPDRPAPAERSGGLPLRTIGLVSGGVGLAVFGIGTVVFLNASSNVKDVDASCPNRTCNDPALVQEGNDARNRRQFGKFGMIGGGILLATGITLFVIGEANQHSGATVSALVGPGSIGIVARTR